MLCVCFTGRATHCRKPEVSEILTLLPVPVISLLGLSRSVSLQCHFLLVSLLWLSMIKTFIILVCTDDILCYYQYCSVGLSGLFVLSPTTNRKAVERLTPSVSMDMYWMCIYIVDAVLLCGVCIIMCTLAWWAVYSPYQQWWHSQQELHRLWDSLWASDSSLSPSLYPSPTHYHRHQFLQRHRSD